MLSSHPVPSVTVTAIAVLLGVGAGLDAGRLALLGGAMLADQLSVGWSNDWIDAERDRAVGRSDKPVARGAISARTVRTAALSAAVVSIGLFFVTGPLVGVTHLVFLASAWSYNAGVKSTLASPVPYLVSFALLPVLVGLVAVPPFVVAWWAVLAGGLLGVAAHFTNVLPDLDEDRRTGVRGVPHRLGRRVSGFCAFALLALAGLTAATGLTGLGTVPVVLFSGVQVAVAGAGAWLVATRPPRRILFLLILLSALLSVAALALSGQRIRG